VRELEDVRVAAGAARTAAVSADPDVVLVIDRDAVVL